MFGCLCSKPHEPEGVGEHISSDHVPHTSVSEGGNYQRVRASTHPYMCHGTQAMNHHFQLMAEFFHHIIESMRHPNGINIEKRGKWVV